MRFIRRGGIGAAAAATLLLAGSRLMAQERDTTEVARLRAQIEAITREIEELKLGREVVARADTGGFGLGPAASKVYRVREGVSLGGYGEVLYEHFRRARQDSQLSGRANQLDALRLIAYLGYKFNDKMIFNSEIEFEHGSTGGTGEVSMEFAYVDYRLSPRVGLRGGLLLVPMGLINELHEPPTFLGTTRPLTEQAIVPSTWRESGLGVFGDLGDFAYRVYLVNGLDAVGGGSSAASGFSAAGIRGGRQNGSRAVAEELAGVARVDYTGVLGLTVGGSVYLGNSGQNRTVTTAGGPSDLDARTVIWESHLAYQQRGLDLRGLFAMAAVDQLLIRRDEGLALLFTPPFERTSLDPGYIKGYPAGIRENGGHYNHAAVWLIAAFAELGMPEKALELFHLCSPVTRASSREKAEIYKVEPYVAVADIYSHPSHIGRGGWSWYTGSAGWLYRAGLEWILGLRLQGDHFTLKPCIPASWPDYQLTFRHGASTYHITVENRSGDGCCIQSMQMDGLPLEGTSISLIGTPGPHHVTAIL